MRLVPLSKIASFRHLRRSREQIAVGAQHGILKVLRSERT
jgi:hypothetical protein